MGRKATNLRKRLRIATDRQSSAQRKLERANRDCDRLRRELVTVERRIPDLTNLVVRMNRFPHGYGRIFGVQVSFDMDHLCRGVWMGAGPSPMDLSLQVRMLTEQMQRQIERAVLGEIHQQEPRLGIAK